VRHADSRLLRETPRYIATKTGGYGFKNRGFLLQKPVAIATRTGKATATRTGAKTKNGGEGYKNRRILQQKPEAWTSNISS
jgi:hypothetical protein